MEIQGIRKKRKLVEKLRNDEKKHMTVTGRLFYTGNIRYYMINVIFVNAVAIPFIVLLAVSLKAYQSGSCLNPCSFAYTS